jgi:hypothetical protein
MCVYVCACSVIANTCEFLYLFCIYPSWNSKKKHSFFFQPTLRSLLSIYNGGSVEWVAGSRDGNECGSVPYLIRLWVVGSCDGDECGSVPYLLRFLITLTLPNSYEGYIRVCNGC